MIKEDLLEDLKKAMKEKNEIRKNTVQIVRAAILQVEKDKNIKLDDEKVLEVIAKECKKRKDSLADYERSGREDLINQIKEEISILEEYLPKQMGEEELTKIIEGVIKDVDATSIKDMGKVMKEAKTRVGVSADGRKINEIVKKLLG